MNPVKNNYRRARLMNLEQHKNSNIVNNYMKHRVFDALPLNQVNGMFMPEYSTYDFFVYDGNKTVGFVIKGYFINKKVEVKE